MTGEPKYYCSECGEKGLATTEDGEECSLCGLINEEPFRVGWDESD